MRYMDDRERLALQLEEAQNERLREAPDKVAFWDFWEEAIAKQILSERAESQTYNAARPSSR